MGCFVLEQPKDPRFHLVPARPSLRAAEKSVSLFVYCAFSPLKTLPSV